MSTLDVDFCFCTFIAIIWLALFAAVHLTEISRGDAFPVCLDVGGGVDGVPARLHDHRMCVLVPFMSERVQGYQHVNERIKCIHRGRDAPRIVLVLSL